MSIQAPESLISVSDEPEKKHLIGGFNVEFPLSPLRGYRVYFRKLEVHQRIREHDTAVIRITSRNLDWFRQFSSGTPVKITYWGANTRGRRGTFVGYVTHVRLVSDDDGSYEREIVCVAASRQLRETSQATYRNMSAPEIVTEIGRRFNFKVITRQHGLRRGTVVQSGETYWELLNKLARRSGYVLRVSGTTIFFLPLEDMIRASIYRAPVLSDYAADTSTKFRIPTIQHIDSWVGDVSDDDERLSDEVVFSGVSPSTGEVFSATDRPSSRISRSKKSRSKYRRYSSQDIALHSQFDAETVARGAAANGALAIDVDLQVSGDPWLTPYQPVQLVLKDRSLSGYWIVKEVVHTIMREKDSRYLCDVTVSTDSVDGLKSTQVRQPSSYRNLTPEVTTGFAPSEDDNSRLRVTRNGFIYGTPVNGNAVGQWVSA